MMHDFFYLFYFIFFYFIFFYFILFYFILFLFYFSLLQRYQNVKAELEAQQNLEKIKMEKLVREIIVFCLYTLQ